MNDAHASRVALYTARPGAYQDLDIEAQILTATSYTPEEFIVTKDQFLNSAPIIAIDFIGIFDMSPLSFLMGALKKLVSGRAFAVAVVGAAEIPIEQFTNDPAERSIVVNAREEGRLSLLYSPQELKNWLDESSEQ